MNESVNPGEEEEKLRGKKTNAHQCHAASSDGEGGNKNFGNSTPLWERARTPDSIFLAFCEDFPQFFVFSRSPRPRASQFRTVSADNKVENKIPSALYLPPVQLSVSHRFCYEKNDTNSLSDSNEFTLGNRRSPSFSPAGV